MLVVSDTSCISNLYQIGHLDILQKLFAKIIIPTAVFNELKIFHSGDLIDQIGSFGISVQHAGNNELINKIASNGIDKGETEAIALSLELKPSFLLIDEKEGKKVANEYGLNTIGIIGVLLLAKENKLIEKVKPVFDKLRIDTKFYFSNSLYLQALKKAGEENQY